MQKVGPREAIASPGPLTDVACLGGQEAIHFDVLDSSKTIEIEVNEISARRGRYILSSVMVKKRGPLPTPTRGEKRWTPKQARFTEAPLAHRQDEGRPSCLHLRDRPVLLVDGPRNASQLRREPLHVVESALLDDLQHQLDRPEGLHEELVWHSADRSGEFLQLSNDGVSVPQRSTHAVPQRACLSANIAPAIYDTSRPVPMAQTSADSAHFSLPSPSGPPSPNPHPYSYRPVRRSGPPIVPVSRYTALFP